MTVSQATFRDAIFDAKAPVPNGLMDGKKASAGNRFSVYRNNVIVSLIDALRSAFPLLYRLLGGVLFSKLAEIYVRKHPPSSPMMMFYGADLPAFLTTFQPLAHIPYLPDSARLDLEMRQSYHAADPQILDPAVFQTDPQKLLSLRFSLTPATRILRSQWPLYDIWRFNFEGGDPPGTSEAQDILIARPQFDPTPYLLPAGGADWLARLQDGKPFGQAGDETVENTPSFDLSTALTLALQTRAIAKFRTKDP